MIVLARVGLVTQSLQAVVEQEPHAHPIGTVYFLRRSLGTVDVVLAQQVFSHAEVAPAPGFGRWVELFAHFGALHHPQVWSARGTDCYSSLVLPGDKSQHLVHHTMPQGQHAQVTVQGGVSKRAPSGGRVNAYECGVLEEHGFMSLHS